MVFIKKTFQSLLLILILFSYTQQHGSHIKEEDIHETLLSKFLTSKIEKFTKYQQANIGAFIISSAPIPIFFLIIIFNIKSNHILDIMSSFAAGALIGDVFIHNLPEIFEHNDLLDRSHSHSHSHPHPSYHSHTTILNKFAKNELLICWGILLLFCVEKIMNYFSGTHQNNDEVTPEKNNEHSHHHHHHHEHLNTNNVVISLLGDFIHNLTDGMAVGAGFNKSLKIGITLSLSIFFHEIPHEVGDFSYLLKQNMNIGSALSSQLFSAIGAFVGVYLSFLIGEAYSNQIISFASGAFLYLAINTILGDLKSSKNLFVVIMEVIAFVLGVWFLLYAM